MEAHTHDVDLCIEILKIFGELRLSYYVYLKPGLMHDLEHLILLFNTKFFCTEVKFTVAELRRTYQYPWEDLCVHEEVS